MRHNRGRLAVLLLIVCAAGGCASNRVGETFASREVEAPALRVGLARFFVVYHTDMYVPEDSGTRLIDVRTSEPIDDDSVETLRQDSLDRRLELLAPVEEVLQATTVFEYVGLGAENPDADVLEERKNLAAYAQQQGLDLVLSVRMYLGLGDLSDKSLADRIGNSYLMQTQTWFFYNADSDRLGSITAKDGYEATRLAINLYDTRDPQFTERYLQLAESVAKGCLAALKREIDAASGLPNSKVKD